MSTRSIFKLVCLMCGMLFQAHADSWGPIRKTEFFSQNRKHMLKIAPHPDWPSKPGNCRATLFREQKEVWSRHLINNHAPVQVFVADSGRYVITMDEWHRVGDLPVVVYGPRGELVRVHSLDSLGLKEDGEWIKTTVTSRWWNEDSISFFGPDDAEFFVRLHWGKWIVIDLTNGDLFQREETFFRDDLRKKHEQKSERLAQYRKQTLAKYAVRMLRSEEAEDRKTGASVCGQEKLTEAIPELRKLLADRATLSTNVPKQWTSVYFVRKAAKEALEAMGEKVGYILIEEPDVR